MNACLKLRREFSITPPTPGLRRSMSESFFEKPILNSPYAYPQRRWGLDETGQPTNGIETTRRRAELVAPILKSRKPKKGQVLFNVVTTQISEKQPHEKVSTLINDVCRQADCQRDVVPDLITIGKVPADL
jgi:type III restriction enzyme